MKMNAYDNKILIVDDNPKNLQVAMNILKDYNVIYAQSGEKALELVSENDFDLILLDIVMPTMDGFKVCEILKSDDKTKDIPIIFLTVKDDEKDIVKGLEAGAVDYLTKPFYSEVLLKRVELHLQLATSFKELTSLNENLNDIVSRQIEDIRKKDQILFKQSKMLAISEMIDMMSEQLTYPLGLIKIQNQGLELKLLNDLITNDDIEQSIKVTNEQLNYLDMSIDDFKSFFKQDAQKDTINLNVMVDRVLLFFKDTLIKEKIEVSVKGDVYLKVDFVNSELKHVLMKLIFNTLYLLKTDNQNKKKIDILFEEEEEYIQLYIQSNIKNVDYFELNELFEKNDININDTTELNLGLQLVKTLVEKNFSTIHIEKRNDNISYSIRFYK
ncbi:MAG: hypothetical protein C0625_02980 [Arcobacter sp.]|nr:MAG: hypothetical protein C0625_02980 [Arcobacter sp.]